LSNSFPDDTLNSLCREGSLETLKLKKRGLEPGGGGGYPTLKTSRKGPSFSLPDVAALNALKARGLIYEGILPKVYDLKKKSQPTSREIEEKECEADLQPRGPQKGKKKKKKKKKKFF